MSWTNMLFQTYENNLNMQGKDDGKVPLAPLAHMKATAQIEITLNQNAEFVRARKLDKEEGNTLIPVSESSAGRSSGVAPHALCDTLSYIAGDFSTYLASEKEIKVCASRFDKYLELLEKWVKSEYSNKKVKSIYDYVLKKQMMCDLIAAGIVELDGDGKLAKTKIAGKEYEKCLVRFIVLTEDDSPKEVWQDQGVISSYISYYLSSLKGVRDICYLTGKEAVISENHPKGIVSACYGAKLISANDEAGFTYRGRYLTSREACTISYEASQAIHSALTWLAARQGVMVGKQDKRTYICWNPKGKAVPDYVDPFGLVDDTVLEGSNTEEDYKKRLKKALAGSYEELEDNDDIVIMGLDAATTGRLSIVYYNELKSSDFMERLANWNASCKWEFRRFGEDGKLTYKIKTPEIRRIVECAFGTERGNFLEVNDKALKEQYQRLMHCMLDGASVPYDIVYALVNRASMPLAYSKGNREWILSTTCAMLAKYLYDRKGEEIKMSLEAEKKDRSYQFGRLLAVYEYAEKMTYDRGEQRETNAIRLQNAYVQHPMTVWKTLEDMMVPYFTKMYPGARTNMKQLISDIVSVIMDCGETDLNRSLDATYLLGYYLQRKELYTKKDKVTSEQAGSKEE